MALTGGTAQIGTGKAYTTIASWEADIAPAAADRTEAVIGECLGEDFSAGCTFQGTETTAEKHIKLTCASNAYHAGVPKSISGRATARLLRAAGTITFTLQDDHIRIDGLEMQYSVASGNPHIRAAIAAIAADNDLRVTRCIIGTQTGQTLAGNEGIHSQDTDTIWTLARNIIYGMGGSAADLTNSAAGCIVIGNTFFACNRSNSASLPNIAFGGITTAHNNLSLDANTNGTCWSALLIGSTSSHNAGSDSSLGLDITNLSVAAQLRNPDTTDWTKTDCRLSPNNTVKNRGLDAGADYATGIQGNPVIGLPDIGADEFVGLLAYRPGVTRHGFFRRKGNRPQVLRRGINY